MLKAQRSWTAPQVPAGRAPKALEVICPWSNTLDTIQTMSWDEDFDALDERLGSEAAGEDSGEQQQQLHAGQPEAAGATQNGSSNAHSDKSAKAVENDEQAGGAKLACSPPVVWAGGRRARLLIESR